MTKVEKKRFIRSVWKYLGERANAALPLCPPHEKLEETGGLTLACGDCLACTLNKAAAIREAREKLFKRWLNGDYLEVKGSSGSYEGETAYDAFLVFVQEQEALEKGNENS